MIKKTCANCIKNKYGTCDKWNMTASAFCFMPSEETEEENSMDKQMRQSAEELAELVAAMLRDLQAECGRLPDGIRIVGPEYFPDTILGIEVIRCPTMSTPTLTLPASYKQARYFEDNFPNEESPDA